MNTFRSIPAKASKWTSGVALDATEKEKAALMTKPNYRLGGAYALGTAVLLSTQEPLSSLAAQHLNTVGFVWVSQVSLALSIPLLLLRRKSRQDFVALLRNRANLGPLAAIFAIGMSGLLLYNLGLATTHPIIIAAVLNLSPFWAALVALWVSKVPIPARPLTFFACLAFAFIGAMAVAWSQIGPEAAMRGLSESLLRGGWIYAVPIPILSALNGTLIARWFSRYDESAAIAANFLAPAVVLIPITSIVLLLQTAGPDTLRVEAVALMMFGTVVAASIGRVLYQIALTVTRADNGFVTMFFLLVPVLTGLMSYALSPWLPNLKFSADGLYFIGLGLIGASLLVFSWRARRGAPASETADPGSGLAKESL
jgi:drug/metabolite transporter (DMT)-like permease